MRRVIKIVDMCIHAYYAISKKIGDTMNNDVKNVYYYRSLNSDGRLHIKLPIELHNDFKAITQKEGVSMSEAVKELMIQKVINNQNKSK